MSRILVTGASGFIGRHFITELLNSEHTVIASGRSPLSQSPLAHIKDINYLAYDLSQPLNNPYDYFHKPEKLVHLAWQGLPNYKSLHHLEINLMQSYEFIKKMVERGVTQVTVLGTCFEYGTQYGPLSEDLHSAPNNAYALAKDTLHKFLHELRKVQPFQLQWVRLFYLYGEGQSSNSILSQLKQALKNNETSFNMSAGEQLRDYLPVETVALYLRKIVEKSEFSGTVNCCSGQAISIRNLVESFLKSEGAEIHLNLGYYPYPQHEAMAFWGNPEKLKQILNDK